MKKLSLRSLIPNLFTFISLTLGLTALKFAIESKWEICVSLVVFASFLDNIDGKIARLLKSNSNFGIELDSLSDLISFGVTPALIIYLWSKSMMIDGVWAMVIFYAICSTSRLAKFNITSLENSSNTNLKYFFGISTPAAAGLTLLPMMLNFRFNLEFYLVENFLRYYLLVPSILMISNIPTFSMKGIKIDKKVTPFIIVLLASFLSLLLTDFWLAIIILISVYFLSIPLAFYDFKKS